MKNQLLLLCSTMLLLASCVVQHPKYARIQDTFKVQIGMQDSIVNQVLRVEPFALHERTDSTYTFHYKYRIQEVKRIPIVMRKNRGVEVEGRFADLFVKFDTEGKAIAVESCHNCTTDGKKEKKIDAEEILASVTTVLVTIPVVIALLVSGNQ